MQSLSRLIVLLGMVALPVWAAQTIDDDLYALQLDYQRAEASQKEAARRDAGAVDELEVMTGIGADGHRHAKATLLGDRLDGVVLLG